MQIFLYGNLDFVRLWVSGGVSDSSDDGTLGWWLRTIPGVRGQL